MKALLGVAVLLVSFAAFAQDAKIVGVGPDFNGSQVTLLEGPCKAKEVLDEITKQIKPEYRDKFSAARGTWEGSPADVCWIEPEEGVVFLMWYDGGKTMMPKFMFKPPV